nr:hypothetical protein [Tanacetum cinerariifolium]
VPSDESEEELSWNSTDEEGDHDEGKDGDGDEEDEGNDGEEADGDDDNDDDAGEEGDDDDDDQEVEKDDEKDDEEEGGDDEQEYDKEEYDEETRDEESFDPIPKTPENSDDEGNGEEDLGLNVGSEEGHDEEEEEDELYKDVNINQGRGIQATLEVEDSHVTLTPINPDGQQQSSSVSSQFMTSMLNPTLDEAPSTIIQDLPNFGSLFGFDNRLRTLEANFYKFMQTNQFAGAVSAIPGIVQRYMDQRINKAIKVAVQIQSDHLHDESQKENDEFLKTVDENMQKIIKEQTSYAVAIDLSEMELKKILIEKMEGNKPIQHFDEQRNLYKALVEAYESDKIILDTYGETVTLKRHRDDDADKDEEPSTGPDWGSKRRREGKEPESASAPMETATKSAGRSTQGSQSRQASASESATAEEPMQTTFQMEEPFTSRVDTLTLKLLAGPTYELMKGSCKSLVELEYHLEEVFKATIDQLDWVNPEGQKCLKPQVYSSITKTKATDYGHIKWIEDLMPRTMWIKEPIGYDKHALWEVSHWGRKRQQFYGFAVNQESARDVYSKRRVIAVTELKIIEWHNYKHLDCITVRRDDDKLYKFKEGDFKRLRIQDIEDMLLLLVKGKLTNLTVEERFAFNVSFRMFTRSIVIQMRVEDLQLGVESYQKKLNLTKSDTYRSDLKRKEAYIAYSKPRGFIYQNKDKKNMLMRIVELHEFSDGTLTDVRTALYDRLKGIRMQYLPQSIWRKSDKDRAAAMIQAIDKRLKTRRIMRSLERKHYDGGKDYKFFIDAKEHELKDLGEAANYKAALLDLESDKWLNAMNVEMQSIKDNEVWELVDLPPNGKTIGHKWLFKKKTNMDGAVHTYKARLVAKGFTQTLRIDYEETFSHVADIRAIRILIAITMFNDYEIWQMDVKNTFLNGYLNEEVYMKQPKGYASQKFPNRVCKLKHSIYGLKQASKKWNKQFDDEIKKSGFNQNHDEPCVYVKASGSYVTFLILYVDDILIMGNNIPMLQDVKSYLGRCFAMKDLGEASYILGIKIYRDRLKRLIGLCQSAYIEKILKRFYMENSKFGTIPMQEKLKFSKSQCASTPVIIQRMQNIPYALANPGDAHWTAVKNILKYLRNTIVCFLFTETGYVFVLNGGPIDWKSTKQSIFATSSTDAGYIAAFDASKEVVWIRKFIFGLGVVPIIKEPINMYCDNTGSKAIAKDHGVTKVPASSSSNTATDTTSNESGSKSGRTVTLSAEDMQKKKNDVKARTTLLLSIPDEHQLRFSKYKTAQELWAVILKTFGGNEATKKTKKNLLKQQYGKFKAEGSETLEQTENEDGNTACVPTASTNVPTASASVATISQDTACAYIASQSSELPETRRDNYRQGSKAEEQAPKALMAIDGVGWDWSYMANDEEDHTLVANEVAPIEFTLMANTSAESKKRVKKSFTPKPIVHRPYRPSQRPVRTNMNGARPNKTSFNKQAHSYENRPFHRTSAVRPPYRAPWVPTVNRNFPPVNKKISTGSRNFPSANRKFTTASRKFLTGSTKCSTANMGMKGKAVKPLTCWFWKPSQNLSNKECIVLGRDFKLLDDANILLRTPRQHNMYSIDLNNIVPHRDLTCLVAKASADECTLWHRRL